MESCYSGKIRLVLHPGRVAICLSLLLLVWTKAIIAQQDAPTGFVQSVSDQQDQQPDKTARLLELHIRIAWLTLSRGDLERAESMFRDILRRDPDRPDEIAGLSAALARQQKMSEAVQVLRDGVRRFPQDATLASALGQAHLNASNNQSAIDWLERSYGLDPSAPDVRYFLGSAYLNGEYPMSALDMMYGAPTSRREMEWAQDLAIGTAFAQLGLESQASGYFTSVYNAAADTPMSANAMQLRQEMDDALYGRPYLSGSLKVTERYDTNPGVIPAANSGGGALAGIPSWGNLYLGQFSYDLIREYNYDVAIGYNFFHTSNYSTHGFDLVDNGVYLATVRREYWNWMPVHLGMRMDYDHMFVGSDDFLQRMVATPSVTFIQSDWHSTTLLFRYTLFDFIGQGPLDNSPFDLDSDDVMIGIVRQRQLLSRRLIVSAGYEFDRNFSDGSNYEYNGHKLQLGMSWRTGLNGLRLNASGELDWRGYLNPHSILGVNRGDEEYLVQVGLLYPLRDRWWASLEWNFDRNDSNIPMNDYRRHSLDFGVEYRFPNGRYDN